MNGTVYVPEFKANIQATVVGDSANGLTYVAVNYKDVLSFGKLDTTVYYKQADANCSIISGFGYAVNFF